MDAYLNARAQERVILVPIPATRHRVPPTHFLTAVGLSPAAAAAAEQPATSHATENKGEGTEKGPL